MTELTQEHLDVAAGPSCHPDALHPEGCKGLAEWLRRVQALRGSDISDAALTRLLEDVRKEGDVEHTPGPWKAKIEDDDNFGISAGWTDVAKVYNDEDDPVCKANAHLIAAAPVLLAALETCEIALADLDACEANVGACLTPNCNQALGQARAAIEMAKGDSDEE